MSDQDGSKLIGTSRLISAYVVVQATGERSDIFGSDPQGCIIVAGGRMMSLMMSGGRTRAGSEADSAALSKSMMAYTGKASVDGEKFTTKVDMAWDPSWLGTEQTRFYSLDGGKLRIRTAPHGAPRAPPARRHRRVEPEPGLGQGRVLLPGPA